MQGGIGGKKREGKRHANRCSPGKREPPPVKKKDGRKETLCTAKKKFIPGKKMAIIEEKRASAEEGSKHRPWELLEKKIRQRRLGMLEGETLFKKEMGSSKMGKRGAAGGARRRRGKKYRPTRARARRGGWGGKCPHIKKAGQIH